jgi:hypothetical protein
MEAAGSPEDLNSAGPLSLSLNLRSRKRTTQQTQIIAPRGPQTAVEV